MKFRFKKMYKRVRKPCYILKIVKIAKFFFDMSVFLLYKLNKHGIHRGCLLEAFGGWNILRSLLCDLLKGYLWSKMSFILVNFVFQDRQNRPKIRDFCLLDLLIKPGEETSLREVKTGLQVNFKSFWYYCWFNQVVFNNQC